MKQVTAGLAMGSNKVRTSGRRHAGALALCMMAACSIAAGSPTPSVDPARDRVAILAMQGEYLVDFAFDETVLLQPGYKRRAAQRSGGHEVVIVVEDTPIRIVLQHILVDPESGHVTKHWRQDWTYEAARRFEFSANQTWQVRAIPAEQTQGAWTQCVHEVSDAPRYCGSGHWSHANGFATWTSDLTWRPLPRREYTKRDDYNAIAAVNRHTITPNGWAHEQFNTKVLREPDGAQVELTREFGFNDYRKTKATDFSPAYRYWHATRDYWATVRSRWNAFLAESAGVHLKTKVDGMAMIIPLFEQANRIEEGKPVDVVEIDAVFTRWVEPASMDASAVRHPKPGDGFGVLVMAHGGGVEWNREVAAALAPIGNDYPIEIAFGMADAASLQEGVRKLEAQGVKRIGVVRLFVSGDSWYERTEQILGIQPGAPAKPSTTEHAAHGEHAGHSMAFWKVDTNAAFALSKQGLADAPEMGTVLVERARDLSRDPTHEDVLILAHGPGDDAENQLWLEQINARADAVRRVLPFRRVSVETLREDWPDKRRAAEARIRAYAERASSEGGRAIVIPYRVQGFGPYAEVLAGLNYTSNGDGLVPHPQVERWVRRQAEELRHGRFRDPRTEPHGDDRIR